MSEAIIAQARKLLDAVTFDDSGVVVGNVRQGGNGGLLSRETLVETEKLRKLFAALDGAVEGQEDGN